MGPVRLVLLVLCLLAPASLAPATAVAKPQGKPCAVRGSATVAQSPQVRVYERGNDDPMSPCRGTMEVTDLRTGRVRYSADAGGFIGLVIKPNGSVAFVLGQQLIRIDTRGTALLDQGAGIDSGSLAVNRTRVYWLNDNIPQSASLR
jgi:hypothetical protein